MTIQTINGGRVFLGEEGFYPIQLQIDNGKIAGITEKTSANPTIQLKDDDLVLPGRIDGHIHGADGHDVMDATIRALEGMAKILPAEGTTSFLPTTMTAPQKNIEQALTTIKEYISLHNNNGKAEVVGIHLEGPFISKEKTGAQNPEHIKKPDLQMFLHWHQLSGENIKVVTIAPEIEQAIPFIEKITKHGIIASIGHSNATQADVQSALEAGANQFTHLYNGMRAMHHREPGVVGAAFLNTDALAEIIVDGLHSSPEMVRLAYEIKGKLGLLLITDSMRAKCLGNGTYDLGGQDVNVKDGKATLENGTLAGSILTMQQSFKNMKSYTDAEFEDLVYMSSINPAKQYGIYDRKGSIEVGKDADLIILDRDGELKMTICRGKIAYMKEH